MTTIELTDEELRLVLSAVRSYRDDFGHDEHEVRRTVRAVLSKLEGMSKQP